MTFVSPALANADVCTSNIKDARSCTIVKGSGRQVDQIKVQLRTWGREGFCWTGHAQVLIGGDHWANGSELSFCGTNKLSQTWTLGTWNNVGRLAAGTRVCSKFWYLQDGKYVNYGSACAVVG